MHSILRLLSIRRELASGVFPADLRRSKDTAEKLRAGTDFRRFVPRKSAPCPSKNGVKAGEFNPRPILREMRYLRFLVHLSAGNVLLR
jgi:hypothetical protein